MNLRCLFGHRYGKWKTTLNGYGRSRACRRKGCGKTQMQYRSYSIMRMSPETALVLTAGSIALSFLNFKLREAELRCRTSV